MLLMRVDRVSLQSAVVCAACCHILWHSVDAAKQRCLWNIPHIQYYLDPDLNQHSRIWREMVQKRLNNRRYTFSFFVCSRALKWSCIEALPLINKTLFTLFECGQRGNGWSALMHLYTFMYGLRITPQTAAAVTQTKFMWRFHIPLLQCPSQKIRTWPRRVPHWFLSGVFDWLKETRLVFSFLSASFVFLPL